MEPNSLAARLAAGPALESLPRVVDVRTGTPPNPPEHLQVQFAGLSFETAYAEAEAFVGAVVDALDDLGHPGLPAGRVLDFGSGWGRITRVLLAEAAPQQVFAVDVDPEMTALVGATLPGVNVLTVPVLPPSPLADASMDVVVAFSVFSHLSGPAHEAWAWELARLVRPGGVVAITVLGEDFIDLVAGCQDAVAAGRADPFAASMAEVFADPAAVRSGFHADRVQFAPTGGGGVRTSDYYGWALASRRCVERVWGAADLELVRWYPDGELFSQAMAVLVRTGDRADVRVRRRLRRSVEHATARAVRRARAAVPRGVVGAVRRFPGRAQL